LRLVGLALVMLLSLYGCQQPPETAGTVVRKVIAAHAGKGRLSQVEGFLFHGHVQALSGDQHGKLWILLRQPEKLRVVVEGENSKEDRLYLDGRGWLDEGEGMVRATGPDYELMKFQAEHLTLPFGLHKNKYRVRLAEEIVAGQPVRLILTDADGIETKISIDPVRWVIRTAERAIDIKGREVLLGVAYEEYRSIKGVQLPHR
ncbi:MAG: hypothetical protein GWN87_29055, partial [Desulfuromonadales bacterium]|nr:hypothetical protein [Desulfuromonadales bacterium]NIS43681.1 hypothetical protein [Desulfuromonadales bacterium]